MEHLFILILVLLLKTNILRVDGQAGHDPNLVNMLGNRPGALHGSTMGQAGAAAGRFNTISTTATVKKRTTPRRISLEEDCDYLAYYCMKAYKTGKLCARTVYYKYHNFTNYCLMDYVNCMERYEVWQVVHMGECFELKPLKDYQHYEYHDDLFLDQTYVIEE